MKRFLKYTLGLILIIIILIGSASGILLYVWSSNLPYIGSLKEYNPPIITEIYSEDMEVIGRFWDEKRIVVGLDQVPKHLVNAFLAAEDSNFFEHEGVDFKGIFRAFLINLKAGKIEQGGSTITQQVTKSLLLKNTKRTYRRKVREIALSIQIENEFSKERILFLYLNQIYLGHGAYGVEAAARTYFGKRASELNIAESALLAGLPQAPSRYSLFKHYDRAKARQRYVIDRLCEEGFISEKIKEAALQIDVKVKQEVDNTFMKAPYFSEHVRQYLEKNYGRELLYKGGLKVFTTLDLGMQKKGQAAIEKGLRDLDKREGYRGPLRHLNEDEIDSYKAALAEKYISKPLKTGDIIEAVVTKVDDEEKTVEVSLGNAKGIILLKDMKWARDPDPDVPYYNATLRKPDDALEEGDLILVKVKEQENQEKQEESDLSESGSEDQNSEEPEKIIPLSLEQEPEIQGAVLCIEAKTGKIRTIVGGRNFRKSQFNRAIQAKRQPGSAFKPFIYSAAIDEGMTPASIIIDAPYISKMKDDDEVWKPKNYKEKFFGRTLFRTALIKSRNVITVKILRDLGVRKAIEYAKRMGITSEMSPDLSLSLGSSGLSLLEVTRAYSVFVNNGMLIEPYYIDRIEDREGRVIEESQSITTEAIPEDTAYVMTDVLKAVIQEGTGWRIKALKRPAAGKTGTTNDLRDAWFMGYTPTLVTGVWVGYDDRKPMGSGETGSRAASPIWLEFMAESLKGTPKEDFPVPEGVVFAKIDNKTGLLASSYSKKTVFQAFKQDTEPKEYTPKPKTAKAGQFGQFDMDN